MRLVLNIFAVLLAITETFTLQIPEDDVKIYEVHANKDGVKLRTQNIDEIDARVLQILRNKDLVDNLKNSPVNIINVDRALNLDHKTKRRGYDYFYSDEESSESTSDFIDLTRLDKKLLKGILRSAKGQIVPLRINRR